MSGWLGVVSADHVARAVSLGIAQLGHGKRAPLTRLAPGDWLVYYSPKTSMTNGTPLQAFTAVGEVVDAEIWQADEGSFQPYRRRIRYEEPVRALPVGELPLDLTSTPNWGYQLRRGLLALTDSDLAAIRSAMTA